MSPCPHCRAAALPEPDAAMRWRCGVCGGPVVPMPDDVPRSHAELASLVAAQRAGAIGKAWLAGALVLGASAGMALGTAALLWSVAHLAATVLAVVAAGTGSLAAVGGRRSRAHRAAARASLDEAWERAADDVLRARGAELTAPTLAAAIRTDEHHAETLLARLSASGRARVAVRDDAELAYRTDDEADATDTEDARGRAP